MSQASNPPTNSCSSSSAYLHSSAELMQKIADTHFAAEDVIVSAYIKSGITLLIEIMCRLTGKRPDRDGGLPSCSKAFFIDNRRTQLPEMGGLYTGKNDFDVFSTTPPGRLVKLHLPPQFLEKGLANENEAGPRFVIVLRNPKDTAVSLFHFVNNTRLFDVRYSWSEYFDRFVTHRLGFGNWCDFTNAWWRLRSHPRVHVVSYESLVRNKMAEMVRLSEFLGVSHTDLDLGGIAAATDFENMRSDEAANPSKVNPWLFSDGFNFLRKGKIGEWKDVFSAEEDARFEEAIVNHIDQSLQFEYE